MILVDLLRSRQAEGKQRIGIFMVFLDVIHVVLAFHNKGKVADVKLLIFTRLGPNLKLVMRRAFFEQFQESFVFKHNMLALPLVRCRSLRQPCLCHLCAVVRNSKHKISGFFSISSVLPFPVDNQSKWRVSWDFAAMKHTLPRGTWRDDQVAFSLLTPDIFFCVQLQK